MFVNTRKRCADFWESKNGIRVLQVATAALSISLSWVSCWSVLGDQCLPFSNIFGILVCCICGKLLGALLGLVKIPPLIGMIAAGIFFRNVPHINIASNINVTWSSVLRTGAFVILLLRAGLGLKLDIIRKNKLLVACLAVLPCVVEVVVIACLSRPLLGLPWNWAFLLGFVIAGVSPAVVIPSMLALKDSGYGQRAGVPTLLMAAATADNAFTITGFSLALTFVFPDAGNSLAWLVLKAPLEIVIGGFCGVVAGYILSYLPPVSPNQIPIQTFLLSLVGFSCVFGLKRLTFAGAGVLAALVMATVAAQTWHTKDEISGYLQKMWVFGEALLFTLVGAQVELCLLSYKIIGYGLLCLVGGVALRCIAAYLSVNCSVLNLKEKLFICASWIPKATVQAAIGSIALDRARELSPEDPVSESYGVTVLCVAVLAIIVTSPPGAALIAVLGPRLLDHNLREELQPIRGGPKDTHSGDSYSNNLEEHERNSDTAT